MKKMRVILCLALAVMLAAAVLPALPAQAAAYSYDYEDYADLIGAMEIVNCQSYASLRSKASTSSTRLARVPLGSIVTNCRYENDRFTYCEFEGVGGYILNDNLLFISGPVGQEYADEAYRGNMQIVNCQSYACRWAPSSPTCSIRTSVSATACSATWRASS